MIVEIKPYGASSYWWFQIKGKNGKVIATSPTYSKKQCLIRCVNKLINTVSWRVRNVK